MTDHVTADASAALPSTAVARERTRFFPGQLVVPDDLTQDQVYVRARLRRHNRLLHGWGVVAGAWVSPGPTASTVAVSAGMVLSTEGDEIVLDDVTVDLCRTGPEGDAVVSGDERGDSRTPLGASWSTGQVLHLAVRYAERPTRPVRVLVDSCGCDDGACEPSRIRDGYVFRALTELPASYDPMPPPDTDPAVVSAETGRPVPAGPSDPWVILADVVMSGPQEAGPIDGLTHRRYVTANAEVYHLGQPPAAAPPPPPAPPPLPPPPPAPSAPAAPTRLTAFTVVPGQQSDSIVLTMRGAPWDFTGQVQLDQPAPAGGSTVVLTSDNPTTVSVPQFVVVPEGATTAAVPVHIASTAGSYTVSASFGETSLTRRITVRYMHF